MFMTNKQPAKLSQPSIGPLHDPAALVPPQLAPVFVPPMVVVLAIRDDQFDSATAQSMAQRIGIVTAIGNHPLRFLSRPAWASRNPNFGNLGSPKLTSLGEALSNRTPSGRPSPSTSTIHFVPLPRLVFPTAEPPFSPGRSCRREKPRPTSTVPLGPTPPATRARHSATRLRLPTA